jgi:hypothetical protein
VKRDIELTIPRRSTIAATTTAEMTSSASPKASVPAAARYTGTRKTLARRASVPPRP